MNKKQYRNWKQVQDDKIIKEAEMKRNRKESPIVRELKTTGNIKEAAAVFSHEGFIFLVEQLGDIVAKELEPMINNMLDKKVTEVFEGLTEGFKRSLEAEGPRSPSLPIESSEDYNEIPMTDHKSVSIKPDWNRPVRRHKWTDKEKQLVMKTVREYKEHGRSLVEAFKDLASVIPDVDWRSVSTRYYVWRGNKNGK